MQRWTLILVTCLAAAAAAACARPDPDPDPQALPAADAGADPVATPGQAGPSTSQRAGEGAAQWPAMTVYKTPACGCCVVWIEHVEAAGIPVEVVDIQNMGPIKQELGVPYGKGSCHTARIGGYFIEGHVPIDDIRRLLDEAPPARGLTLPGMPLGSPGMEVPDGRSQAFTVELVGEDGSTTPWAHHPAR